MCFSQRHKRIFGTQVLHGGKLPGYPQQSLQTDLLSKALSAGQHRLPNPHAHASVSMAPSIRPEILILFQLGNIREC
jgi:hypothetical protein